MKAILHILRARMHGAAVLAVLFFLSLSAYAFIFLRFLLQGNPRGAAIALLYLLITLFLPLPEHLLRIRVPTACYALLFFLCFGSLLGSAFNFYFRFPYWDTALHLLSGILFAYIGYLIGLRIFPSGDTKGRWPYIFTGILFSLSVALLWELFEAGATAVLFVDMQEDTLLHTVKSFYLSGTHDHPLILTGITETVIHYGDGQIFRIPGYLDLGLSDTLSDMAVCLLGNLLFVLLLPLDRLFHGRLLPSAPPPHNDP